MPYFSDETLKTIDAVARDHGIAPAALRAVAEVESGGRAFAFVGGRQEPVIRFEGHYFDRLLDPDGRKAARAAGLASPAAGAVKNPRTQADRWRLIDRAARIDRQAALQSVSWGIGQVMGVHWKALGYDSVDALVRQARSGVDGQLVLMIRFMQVNRLLPVLHARDWAGFARRYNGPGYARNRYDTRLAAAYSKHRTSMGTGTTTRTVRPAGTLARGARGPAVRDLQIMLTAAGYPLSDDGVFGPLTQKALRAFQFDNDLAVDGVYGPQSARALSTAVSPGAGLPGFWARFRSWWRRLTR